MSKNNLIKAWQLNQGKLNLKQYISDNDLEYLNLEVLDQRKHEKRLMFDMIPQPFWGNVDNPSVIVLFSNPGYKEKEKIRENEDAELRKKLFNNLNGQSINYISKDDLGVHSLKYLESANYWINAFKDIDKNIYEETDLSSKVAIFEFLGYPSKSFKSFTKKEVKGKYLPSQIAIFDYIKEIIKKSKPLIMIARSRKLWLEAIPELKDEHYILTRNPRVGSLNKGNLDNNDFETIIRIVNKSYELSKILKDKTRSYTLVYSKLEPYENKFNDILNSLAEEVPNYRDNLQIFLDYDKTKTYQKHNIYQFASELSILGFDRIMPIEQLDDEIQKDSMIYKSDELFYIKDSISTEAAYHQLLYIFSTYLDDTEKITNIEKAIVSGKITKILLKLLKYLNENRG